MEKIHKAVVNARLKELRPGNAKPQLGEKTDCAKPQLGEKTDCAKLGLGVPSVHPGYKLTEVGVIPVEREMKSGQDKEWRETGE